MSSVPLSQKRLKECETHYQAGPLKFPNPNQSGIIKYLNNVSPNHLVFTALSDHFKIV